MFGDISLRTCSHHTPEERTSAWAFMTAPGCPVCAKIEADNTGANPLNLFQSMANDFQIFQTSKFVQVLFADGSEKIFKIHTPATCTLIVKRKKDEDEWKRIENPKIKPVLIDKEIRLKGFSKMKATSEDEVSRELFVTLL